MIVRSTKYLAGSRGAPCTFRIGGVCTGDAQTTVPAHLRDRHTGRSIKASDLSVGDGCQACHDVFDRRAPMPNGQLISDADWLFYALRALQETLERRVELGLLTVAGFDPHAAPRPRRVKARKPKGQRRPVPQGRKLEGRSTIPSRPFRRTGGQPGATPHQETTS